MKSVRYILWALVAVVVAGMTYLSLDRVAPDADFKLGADFELQSTSGKTVRHKDMLGRPHLIFFGFTHCPEICPTTLYEASGWMEAIGDKAKDLDIYFVSIDPERDTVEALTQYLSLFEGNIQGLTGSLEEMDKAAKGYHVFYRKIDTDDGDYTMDHTASVYLMRPDGSFQGTIGFGEEADSAIAKIQRLLDS